MRQRKLVACLTNKQVRKKERKKIDEFLRRVSQFWQYHVVGN
jgi:hypothetical protein